MGFPGQSQETRIKIERPPFSNISSLLFIPLNASGDVFFSLWRSPAIKNDDMNDDLLLALLRMMYRQLMRTVIGWCPIIQPVLRLI